HRTNLTVSEYYDETHAAVTGPVLMQTDFAEAYFLEVEGVVAQITFEDGSTTELPLGGVAQLQLPPGADVDGDGRADVSARLVAHARLYDKRINTTHVATSPAFGQFALDTHVGTFGFEVTAHAELAPLRPVVPE